MRKKLLFILASVLSLTILSSCDNGGGYTSDNGLSFSKESGIYEEAFSVEIAVQGNYDIYYTTDGSDPAHSDTAMKYKGAIEVKDRSGDDNVVSAVSTSLFSTNYSSYSESSGITCRIPSPSNDAVDKCTAIRAVAKDKSGNVVYTAGETYFIGTAEEHIQGIKESCEAAGQTLAVISITMNYDDLFDHERGIYVMGASFDESLKEFKKQNKWFQGEDTRKLLANYSQRGRQWERDAHIEMFEMDADSCEEVLSQDCGIRIQGNYSRSDVQKGFRLYARTEYGASKFEYAIFGEELVDIEGETIDKFDTFVLRAGGNCAFTCKYNDTFWQDLASDMALSTKASRPCVVYLNGEYWGLYILEEDFSDDYFDDHYNVNKDDVVLYKGDAESYDIGYKLDLGEIPDGEKVTYYFEDLLNFFDTHKNLKNQKDYDEFAKLVDVESVMDYFAAEVWINNKWDWPGKNWSMWKTTTVDSSNEYNDGKWRFCLYDIEFGGVSGASDAGTNTIKEDNYKPKGLLDMNTDNPAVLCFAYLMTNEGFRTEYCNRLLELSDTVFEKDAALATLDEYESIYRPLFDQFFERYPKTGSTSEAFDGGYASSRCISDFLKRRYANIQRMIDWVNNQY